MNKKIPAGKFKAECLQVMEKVRKTRRKITITKRNVPIAQLGPIDEKEERLQLANPNLKDKDGSTPLHKVLLYNTYHLYKTIINIKLFIQYSYNIG